MTAGPAGKLYTPDLLALAIELASFPLEGDWTQLASARSRTCGSSVTIGLQLDDHGRINRLGLAVTACAVGQASAATFARAAGGRNGAEIAAALKEIEVWLARADAPLPHWPGFAALAPARSYSGRHGALLLPWKAAADALCKDVITG